MMTFLIIANVVVPLLVIWVLAWAWRQRNPVRSADEQELLDARKARALAECDQYLMRISRGPSTPSS